jgi:hypothetical protein
MNNLEQKIFDKISPITDSDLKYTVAVSKDIAELMIEFAREAYDVGYYSLPDDRDLWFKQWLESRGISSREGQ